jgi:cytochrome P450 family 135
VSPLPPGPRAPVAVQTYEWVARPTALLDRCADRYGDPFTLRTSWVDGPMVLVSDPGEIGRIFGAAPSVLRGGASSPLLAPFAGPNSLLLLSGDEHLRQRRLQLPIFHGARLEAHRALIAHLARTEIAGWAEGVVLRAHPRMQALTLEVILRVVFGAREGEELHALRVAIRRALDLTMSLPRLAAMAIVRREIGPRSPWATFTRAVGEVDTLLYGLIRRRRAHERGESILGLLLSARHDDGTPPSDQEVRDELVTLLAAGHETTAAALAWAVERLARDRGLTTRVRAQLAAGEEALLDAVVKETLRVRPVLSIAPRRLIEPFTVGGWELPPGVHVAPCIYLTHRRPDLYPPDPGTFRPERFLDGGPTQRYAWIPFGGGVRRCLGAAFATLEMKEVLRAVISTFELRPDRPRGERTRRRSVTLAPARGARVVVRYGASTRSAPGRTDTVAGVSPTGSPSA